MNASDLTTIILAVIGILYFPVVVLILRRRGFREWAARLLVVYVAASSLWTLLQAVLLQPAWFAFSTDDVLERVLFYGLLLLSLLFLHLSRSFLRLEGNGRDWWLFGVVWTAVGVILDSNLLALPEVLWLGIGLLVERQELVFCMLAFGWGVFMGGATLLTMRAYRRTPQPLHRNRITYWSLALGLIVAAAALLFVRCESLGSGLYLLGTFSVVYVVLTHRLPDVRRTARRTVSYLLITLLAVVIYTTGFLVTYYLFRAVPGYSPLLAGVILALVLAILFDPLLRLVQRSVNRLISGTARDPSRTLREYSTSISNILDLELLATVAVGLIGQAVGSRHGALFVVHYEKGKAAGESGYFQLRGMRGVGEGDLLSGTLPAKSPVAAYLCREHAPLAQYDIDLHPRFRAISSAERDWLDGLDMDVYMPIYAKEEWIGLLALGPKVSRDRYFDDDMILLSTLADQTAVALENARLFDDLKARNIEIEQLNEELAAANREMAQLDQAKSDFIDIASHELRTPLTQVRGYTDMLKEMLEGKLLSLDAGEQLISGLKKANQRLEEIVDTMFDVSQIDTETLDLNLSEETIASIVGAAVDTWATALEQRQQTLTVESLADIPPIVVDCERMEQVFSHLIQNAIKYTPDGGQIRITGHLLGEGMGSQEPSIKIVVADTGIGIAPDDLERIFLKFYRVGDALLHSTGRIKFKGAGPGLGLTIARGIVEAHGGRIWAESPGGDEETCPGSQFHVVLPVQPGHPKSDGVSG